MMKFGTNIGYGKLCCVLKKESAISCLSVPLFVHFSFSLIEISVTDFSAPIYASFFKFCIYQESVKVYRVRENQIDSICFSILFPLCSFSICHSCIMNREISVKNVSGIARHWMMKFDTNIVYGKLYCVRKNQPSLAYQSLYLSIFLSL